MQVATVLGALLFADLYLSDIWSLDGLLAV